MSENKISIAQSVITEKELEAFEYQLLVLSREYLLRNVEKDHLLNNYLKHSIEKFEQGIELNKFEDAYLNDYAVRSLARFLPILQTKISAQLNIERENEDKKLKEQAVEKQKMFAKYQLKQAISDSLATILFDILSKLESNTRLSEEDAIWLNTIGEKFFNTQVRHKFHRLEADYFLKEYSQDPKNIWNAINASSHLRKCNESQEAEELLKKITINNFKDKTLASAYFTTLGGVRRDLKKMNIALDNASNAHSLNPKNYQPCTLLGAIYMEIGDYTLGDEWYEKASARGADTQSINAELKRIISKMDNVKRKEIIASLLKIDSRKYSWLASLEKTVVNKPTSKKNKDELLTNPQKKTPKPASKKSAQKQVTKTSSSKQRMNQSKASSVKPTKK